jgi:hypothetical protein
MTNNNSGTLLAGVGKVDITNRDSNVFADNPVYARAKKHIPEECLLGEVNIHDPLYVRVLILDDGNEKVAIVTLDTSAVACRTTSQGILADSADDYVENVRKRINKDFGIPGENITVSASHTHPPGFLLCEDAEQIERTAEAFKQALENMQLVKIGCGMGEEKRLTTNRTVMMKDGRDITIRAHNPFPPEDEIEAIRPVDTSIGFLRLDRLDGTPFAILYNFSCHLLQGAPNRGITADFPAFASKYIEETLGGGVAAIFLQGSGGDVDEVTLADYSNPKSCIEFGTTLGQSTVRAVKEIETHAAKLKVVTKNIKLPLRTDIPAVIKKLKGQIDEYVSSIKYLNHSFKTFLPMYINYSLNEKYPGHIASRYMQAEHIGDDSFARMDESNRIGIKRYLDAIAAMEKIARNHDDILTLEKHQEVIEELGSKEVPAEIKGIKIGEDTVMITIPMEVLSEIGLNVKKASPFKYTLISSLANGYYHYAPPASYYPRGGYEVTECMLAPEWEEVFEETVAGIFEELKN